MSYPLRTAFFCSSIVIFCKSVILRLTVLIALVWSTDWMCIVTIKLDSISRKSASIRSLSSGARICRNDTAPSFFPMPNSLPVRNSKELGAMKSFTERPLGASHSHSKANSFCSSMWNISCIRAKRCFPFNGSADTPSRLKLLSRSVSMRSSLGFAVFTVAASMPKVRYFVLIRPLLPRAS